MNQLKTAFLLVAMTVLLVLVGRVVGQMIGIGSAGIYVGLALAAVMNGSAYWFSDRIALASAQAREVSPAEAPMLYRLAERLAIQYRVPTPKVYVSPDPSPNAFATGRNPAHAAICVNQGLLQILDEEELYGVLAHECGRHQRCASSRAPPSWSRRRLLSRPSPTSASSTRLAASRWPACSAPTRRSKSGSDASRSWRAACVAPPDP